MKIHCKYDELVKIENLLSHPKNPNRHSSGQIKRLSQILQYQGWRYPVKVSRASGFVTSGHGRIEAAKENGWTEIPVNYQEYESSEQEYADVVADNAIAAWSDLDLTKIRDDFEEIEQNIDVDLLGIRDFGVDIDEINKGDENSAWVDLPEFKEGEDYIKITYFFSSIEQRDEYVKKNNIEIDKKVNDKTWIHYVK